MENSNIGASVLKVSATDADAEVGVHNLQAMGRNLWALGCSLGVTGRNLWALGRSLRVTRRNLWALERSLRVTRRNLWALEGSLRATKRNLWALERSLLVTRRNRWALGRNRVKGSYTRLFSLGSRTILVITLSVIPGNVGVCS